MDKLEGSPKRGSPRQRAYTIIETLVYLALFTLIIGGLVSAAYALFENVGRNQTRAMLQEEQNFVIAKIMWQMNNIQRICVPVANTVGTSMIVQEFGGSCLTPGGTIELVVDDIVLNGDHAMPLNNSNVMFTDFLVTHYFDAALNADRIELSMTATAKAPNGMSVTQSATSTRYLRK